MYSIGDYVVKANTGICVVEDIVERSMSEFSPVRQYYVLIPLEDRRSRLFVPVASEVSNIRTALDQEKAMELIKSIPTIAVRWIESDRVREKEYKDVMKSNDPVALVSIIKNLYLRRQERIEQGKKVTAIDDRYFKLAENTLYAELAHALGTEKDDIRRIIDETISVD